jgi:hypothetical protein
VYEVHLVRRKLCDLFLIDRDRAARNSSILPWRILLKSGMIPMPSGSMRIISTSEAEPLVGLMIPTMPRHVSDAIFFPPFSSSAGNAFCPQKLLYGFAPKGLLQKLTRASRVSKSGKRG